MTQTGAETLRGATPPDKPKSGRLDSLDRLFLPPRRGATLARVAAMLSDIDTSVSEAAAMRAGFSATDHSLAQRHIAEIEADLSRSPDAMQVIFTDAA